MPNELSPENAWKIEDKIIDEQSIIKIINKEKLKSSKIVFTNGCFDLLHNGHIEILRESRKSGDCLIVGLNSDASTKRLKGDSRPIQDEHTRALVLSALVFVDYIIIFDKDTPMELIEKINPDVLVKGGDYTFENIVGAEHVTARGGAVKIIKTIPGYSTTSSVNKMKK